VVFHFLCNRVFRLSVAGQSIQPIEYIRLNCTEYALDYYFDVSCRQKAGASWTSVNRRNACQQAKLNKAHQPDGLLLGGVCKNMHLEYLKEQRLNFKCLPPAPASWTSIVIRNCQLDIHRYPA
jgi:hypothetical protein